VIVSDKTNINISYLLETGNKNIRKLDYTLQTVSTIWTASGSKMMFQHLLYFRNSLLLSKPDGLIMIENLSGNITVSLISHEPENVPVKPTYIVQVGEEIFAVMNSIEGDILLYNRQTSSLVSACHPRFYGGPGIVALCTQLPFQSDAVLFHQGKLYISIYRFMKVMSLTGKYYMYLHRITISVTMMVRRGYTVHPDPKQTKLNLCLFITRNSWFCLI